MDGQVTALEGYELLTKWAQYLTQFTKDEKQSIEEACSLKVNKFGGARIPQAGPSEDGFVCLTWEKGDTFYQLDLLKNGSVDWFARVREWKYGGGESKTLKEAVGSMAAFFEGATDG